MRNFLARFLTAESKHQDTGKDDNLYIYESKKHLSVILVTVLCVDPELLDEIVRTTKAKLPADNDRLVYLTDSPDFETFRRHGVFFEYMPSMAEQRLHPDAIPWQAHLRERWALLLAKWRPRQILSYGTGIDGFLAAASRKEMSGQAVRHTQ
ncbi:MAG: hypothetical protein H0T56_15600 [Pseudaminobacter sp.]|nr:hypothetical protein [Pseudaminobacter sp.]